MSQNNEIKEMFGVVEVQTAMELITSSTGRVSVNAPLRLDIKDPPK